MDLITLIDSLKSGGYKVTQQRKAMLEVLLLNSKTMLSIENIIAESKKIYNKINMSTVYRNLEILEELDLLCIVSGNDGVTLYKLISSTHHHHHLVCKECGKTENIEVCPFDTFKKIATEKKFHLTDHKLELYGYCDNCNNKNK